VEVTAILAYNTITADLTKRWLHVTHVDLHLEVCILVMGGWGGDSFIIRPTCDVGLNGWTIVIFGHIVSYRSNTGLK